MNASNFTENNDMGTTFQEATYLLLLIPPPILIALGTAGNLVAFYVVNKSARLHKESVVVYLRLYFILSALVLIIGSGQDWLCHATGLPFLWNYADYICRLWEFSSNLLFYFPPWILSAILVDRYLLAVKSSWGLYVCNVFSAKVISAVIFVGLTTITVHVLWTFELHPVFGCAIPPDRDDFHSVVWPWVSVIAYSFFPTGVLLFCSVSIVCAESVCSVNVQGSYNPDHNEHIVEMDYISPELQSEINEENVVDNTVEISFHHNAIIKDAIKDGVNGRKDACYTGLTRTENKERLPRESEDQLLVEQRQSAISNNEKSLTKGTLNFNQTDSKSHLPVKGSPPKITLSDGQVVQQGHVKKYRARRTTSDGHIGLVSHQIGEESNQRRPILTTMSICMGIVCVMATLPATVLNVFVMQAPVKSVPDRVKMEKLHFVFALFQMIVVLSKAIMPFIVFLTAPMLRDDLRQLITTKFSKERSSSMVLNTAVNGTIQVTSSVCPGIQDSLCKEIYLDTK